MLVSEHVRRLVVLTLFLLFWVKAQAVQVEQLLEQNPRQALNQLNTLLSNDANDHSALFFKAVALENLGEVDQAITAYRDLIARKPDSPEPYVNLARLYTKQGKLSQAKQTLIDSFEQHEVFATAFQGLQQINAHLAAKAYQQALNKQTQLESPEIRRFTALKSVKTNINAQPTEIASVASKEITQTQKTTVQSPPVVAVKTSSSPAVESVSEQVSVSPPQLRANVMAWAKAWSDRDVVQFISYYATDYTVPNKTRAEWLSDRRLKITNKKFIKVNVGAFKQQVLDDGNIQVDFVQSYRSDTIADTIRKRLTFKKFGVNWKIIAEKVIR